MNSHSADQQQQDMAIVDMLHIRSRETDVSSKEADLDVCLIIVYKTAWRISRLS